MKYQLLASFFIYLSCSLQVAKGLECYKCQHTTAMGVNEQLPAELRSHSHESCKHGNTPDSTLLQSCDGAIQDQNAVCATVQVKGSYTMADNKSTEISMVIRDCYSWHNETAHCFKLPGKTYKELPGVPYICKDMLTLNPETLVDVCLCRDSGCNKENYFRAGRQQTKITTGSADNIRKNYSWVAVIIAVAANFLLNR